MKKEYLILDTKSNRLSFVAEVWQVTWKTISATFVSIKTDSGNRAPIKRMAHDAVEISGLMRIPRKKLAEPAEIVYRRLLHKTKGCKTIIGLIVDIDADRLSYDASNQCSPELAVHVKAELRAIPMGDISIQTKTITGKEILRLRWMYGRLCYRTFLEMPSLVELAYELGVDYGDLRSYSADGDVELTRPGIAAISKSNRETLKGLKCLKQI